MIQLKPQFYFLLLVSAFVFCSCGRNEDSSKKVFRYNAAEGISSLDPAFARSQANIWACNQIFNGLVQLDNELKIQPCIAKSYDISNDGRIYTFHLRNDVFFHDDPLFENGRGRKVVAPDFAYSFHRIADKKTASAGSWVFSMVDADKATHAPAFITVNDSTFQIHLSKPFPPFLSLLSSQYCSVVPHEIASHYGRDFRNHPIGTGPFKFHLWVERTNLILWKNENYFERGHQGSRLPYLDAISVSFISDRQSAFLEFVKGNLDFYSGLDGSFKDDLLTRGGNLKSKYEGRFRFEVAPYLNTEYLAFMMDTNAEIMHSNPLAIKQIRQAINYGFDRKKMIAYLRNNIGTAATAGFVPQGLPSFDSSKVKGYDYNPGKASQLLLQAGFPNGKNLPLITLSATAQYQDLCEYIQAQLAETGIRIKLEINQPATHREMMARQKLAFFRGSWIADYPDAENYLALFYSKNFAPAGPNYTHYANPEFDRLYEHAMTLYNDTLRFEVYRQMENMLLDDPPFVVLYYDKTFRMFQNDITGLITNPMNLLVLKTVKKN